MSIIPKPKPKTVSQVVNDLIRYMRKIGGAKEYLNMQERILKRFLKFSSENRLANAPFRYAVVERYLRECEIPSFDLMFGNNTTSYKTQVVMRKVIDFHRDGYLIRRRRGTSHLQIPDVFKAIHQQYIQYRIEEKEIGPRTMRLSVRETANFLTFLSQYGLNSVSKIKPDHIDIYFKRSATLAPGTIATKAYNIREFFRYLIMQNMISPRLLALVPHVRYVRRSRLPDVWPPEAVEKLLASIDRHSPLGKRDYAICVLIARLGMRIGDVRVLCFENVDWNKGMIKIIQQKTKVPLEIPLTEEVGTAMIDYLKHGRPQTDSHHIFVLHNSPFTPFGINANLHHVIDKYRRNAGITLPEGCRRGFHTLRHTVATRLHEADVPIHVIASLLGHSSVETTRHYAKVNIEQLRKAALEWKEDDHE